MPAEPAPPLKSPELQPDSKVTFRLRAPQASEVSISGDWGPGAPLTHDETGVWSVTLGPLTPDIYGYSFHVDGLRILDPSNPQTKPMRTSNTSLLEIPGAKPSPCDPLPGSARGTVHLHNYESHALGTQRRMRVYTPANYESQPDRTFPVLYLFHGSGDNEATWTELGRAHVILDNLIAAGRVKPMVVVMTDGHATTPESPDSRNANLPAFAHDLIETVMPLIESRYRTVNDRDNRAIIGLSMGGCQSLYIGLNHLERFAWVGGMSSAVREPERHLAKILPTAEAANTQLRLLWFACGKDDFLLPENQHLDALFTEHQLKHEYIETVGTHTWPVWRRYLAEFLPKLFVDPR